ncbi:hypothetical protein RvY_03814 [Ramazzottius varieornatus]|uniref:Uncharacterized protein n=1 Tax=Ramazzottius varieornatus TaxID=947166 RepID=A0A1D1UWG9_RAMVA|nr:hypothetical protein RvY_03814 [Ramazzottius varieornatus]
MTERYVNDDEFGRDKAVTGPFWRCIILLDGAVDVAVGDNEETTLDLVVTRVVDAIVAENGKPAPGTMGEDGRRMLIRTTIRQARQIKFPSALPGSDGEPKSA